MEYSIGNIRITTEFEMGELESAVDETIGELEPYEEVMYRTTGDQLIIDAMNMHNGEIRTVETLDLNDYVYVSAREST